MTIRNTTHLTLARALSGIAGLSSFQFDKDGAGAPEPARPNPAPSVQGLREEFQRLHTEATAIVDGAISASRELTADEKAANETRFTRMNAIKSTLDEQARFASLALSNVAAPQSGRTQTPTDAPGRAAFDASEGRTPPAVVTDDPFAMTDVERQQFSRECNRYVRTGEEGPIAKRFATITTTSNSGLLLPRSVGTPIVPTAANAFRAAHTLLGVSPVVTSGTANLDYPVMDATAGGVVAENDSSENENGSISGKIPLLVKTFESGSIWFSNQQLAANDFDLLTTVLPGLTYNKELGLESAIAAALIADADITQSVATATTTGFTYANLVDLNLKLPRRFDTMKAILLGAAAYSAAHKLVGDDGHPVLVKDPQNEGVMRFNGTPVLRCDYLEAFGTSKVVGCVISLMGFKLRDVSVQNLARYKDQPGRPNQTGLNLFAYHAYGWTPTAVAKLTTPAS